MIRPHIKVILTAVLLLCMSAALRAEDTYAVIIGISNYSDKNILPRPHAEDDAKALFDVLANKDYRGVPADHAKLLLGSDDADRHAQIATKENIIKSLQWLGENAKQDDLVFLSFIGEAGTLTDEGEKICYFATDSTVKNRAKDSVLATDIGTELDKLKSRHCCVFLDVNFKGFTPEKGKAPEPSYGDHAFSEFLGAEPKNQKEDQPKEESAANGRVLFIASVGKQPSPDLDKHGLFAEVIVKGLMGAADVADKDDDKEVRNGYEPDGLVTIDKLSRYFGKQVGELVREKFKGQDDKRPDPAVLGGAGTHFVLTYNPPARAEALKREEKFDALVKDKKLDEKYSDEGKKLLDRMPKLKAQQSLRKEYEQLVDGKITAAEFEQNRDKILTSMKLRRTDALVFGQKILAAASKLKENYVKTLEEGELVNWAVKGMYRRLEEKIPDDIQNQLAKTKDMKEVDLLNLIVDARINLGDREDLGNHKDIDIALMRMTSHLDPYTTYFDREAAEAMNREVNGNFRGVGIKIRKDPETDMLKVITPLRVAPAYKAKIMAGDIITRVTNFVDEEGKKLPKPETISTKGLKLNDAVEKILGVPDTQVKLTVQREGVDKPLDFTLTREEINVESVFGFKRNEDDSWDYMLDPKSKIGFIHLTSFQRNSDADMKKVVEKLTDAGMKGLVLDLRNDPGGLLPTAIKISDLFIDDGLIVSIRQRPPIPEERHRGHSAGSYLDFPMVCLVNGNSASGSEIVAACLQDHKRAVIIGERSFGKGSVQTIAPFDGGALKMTIATFWRPNGKNLNKSATTGKDDEEWGVRPDAGFEVKLSREEQEALLDHQMDLDVIPRRDRTEKNPKPEFKDRQLDKALEYLRDQIKTARNNPDKNK